MEILSKLEPWSWLAGVASFVVAMIALVAQFYTSKNKSNQQESNVTSVHQVAAPNSTQFGVFHGNYTVNHAPAISTSFQHAKQPDIAGRWELAAATQIAKTHLAAENWSATSPDMEEPLIHKLVGDYSLVHKNKEGVVLVFSTITEGHDCHACAPYLSFFEFEKREAGWDLITSDVGAYQAGSWGEAPNLSVHVVAEDKYGVFMKDGYTAQGWSVCSTSIHARIGDTFREIMLLITAQSDPEGRAWDSKLTMLPTSTGFYNIEVQRWGENGPEDLIYMEGNIDLKSDVAGYDEKIKPHDIFKFDGQRYRINSAAA